MPQVNTVIKDHLNEISVSLTNIADYGNATEAELKKGHRIEKSIDKKRGKILAKKIKLSNLEQKLKIRFPKKVS